jgi:multiple sugar transport system substrate-binding protein
VIRTTIAVLTAALALVVAACGGSSGGGSAPVAGGKASGTINVWAWGNEGEILGKLTKEFEAENPGVKVKVTSIPVDASHDKILTSIAGGQSPDVAMVGTTWMVELARTQSLDEAPASIDQSQFFKGAADTVKVDGKTYGVPWYVETRLLYYRTDIAKKAGVTEAPKTWDELKEAARKMQEQGGAKYGINLSTNNWQEYLPFVWQAGGDLAQGDKFTLNTPQGAEATAFYKSFADEGLSPNTTKQGFDITPAFVRGTHPMFFSGPWHMGLIKEAGGAGFDKKWAVAPMPTKETNTSFVGGSNWAVFKATKNRDAAWKFVQWTAKPETQAKWYEISSDLPANQAAWDLPQLKDDPNVEVFGQQLENAKSPPPFPKWEEIGTALNNELDKVIRTKDTGQQAAEQLEKTVDSIGTA